ncbi:MAG: FecR family protein [Melioribacteraceae bacterium]|nr:FecR family protein [Melioribacteraceae bacterium]MCF8354611.1 FecR family protein [Melioribacteraceae bacterium]MCF8396427.1 FecR family protein [Melioribacteraceae bacterium]MCF8420188.1 FecR family protein [Melioribacteraceae bacterium]
MSSKNNYFSLLSFIAILLSFSFLGLLLKPADTPIGVVNKVVKDVTFKSGDSDWVEAKSGLTLKDQDVIRTGTRSLALITYLDGSIIRVREKSEITIYGDKSEDKLDKNTYVDEGKVSFDVKKQSEDEEFKFTTPTMVASIRGTSGLLEVMSNLSSSLSCESGAIEVLSKLGTKQSGSIGAGETAFVDPNGNLNITQTEENKKKQMQQLKNVDTKKIRIKTENGTIEIEYIPEGK